MSPLVPKAVRVRTSDGWQDIALKGADGAPGVGVPAGGVAGAVLRKSSATDYASSWFTAPEPVEKFTNNQFASASFTAPTELNGGTLGDLRHNLTPAVNCWLEVDAETIIQVLDAAWLRLDAEWRVSSGTETQDARAVSKGAAVIRPSHNALVWQGLRFGGLFKLEAGKNYGFQPVLTPSSGTWQFWLGHVFTRTRSKVVGYW